MLAAITDHLWQSLLCLLAATVFTAVLRNAGAIVRLFDDFECSNVVGQATAAGLSVDVRAPGLSDGASVYASIERDGVESGCSAASASLKASGAG